MNDRKTLSKSAKPACAERHKLVFKLHPVDYITSPLTLTLLADTANGWWPKKEHNISAQSLQVWMISDKINRCIHQQRNETNAMIASLYLEALCSSAIYGFILIYIVFRANLYRLQRFGVRNGRGKT